jgi:hypothetical protein
VSLLSDSDTICATVAEHLDGFVWACCAINQQPTGGGWWVGPLKNNFGLAIVTVTPASYCQRQLRQ